MRYFLSLAVLLPFVAANLSHKVLGKDHKGLARKPVRALEASQAHSPHPRPPYAPPSPRPSPPGHTGQHRTSNSGKFGQLPKISLDQGRLPFGLLPDDSSAGGTSEELSELDLVVGGRFQQYGRFSQVDSNYAYNASQLYSILGDILASQAILEVALMPKTSWLGFTPDNNTQAVNVCKEMKNLTSQGIPVRLRFAPEFNYYLVDAPYNADGMNTYPGNFSDFLTGFKTVANVCHRIAPKVKLVWNANISSNITQIEEYFPGSEYVDYVASDYYAKNSSELNCFYSMQVPFYKAFANERHPMIQTETGLQFNGTIEQKLYWLNTIVEAKNKHFPLLESVTWYNFLDTMAAPADDFRLVDPTLPANNAAFERHVKTGKVPAA